MKSARILYLAVLCKREFLVWNPAAYRDEATLLIFSGQKLCLQIIYCTLNHAGFVGTICASVGAGHARDPYIPFALRLSKGRGQGPLLRMLWYFLGRAR